MWHCTQPLPNKIYSKTFQLSVPKFPDKNPYILNKKACTAATILRISVFYFIDQRMHVAIYKLREAIYKLRILFMD